MNRWGKNAADFIFKLFRIGECEYIENPCIHGVESEDCLDLPCCLQRCFLTSEEILEKFKENIKYGLERLIDLETENKHYRMLMKEETNRIKKIHYKIDIDSINFLDDD